MLCNKGFFKVFSVLSWLGLLGTCPVFGAGWKILPGHVPRELSQLKANGQLAATNQLQLALGLSLRDPAGLDDFLAQVYDPASPNYRHYLTPEEITARFGPTEKDYAAVKDYARTNGLTVTTTYGNRLVLAVTGPASAVEKAFHVTLRTYRHPTEARDFFAPDSEPSVDVTLPVADISGLNNMWRPHPKIHRPDASTQIIAKAVAKGGTAPDGISYLGQDLRQAYVPDTTLTGAGQMVGLLQFDGFSSNNIAKYEDLLPGKPRVPLQTILLDGYSGAAGSGEGEVCLDIEMAIAMAPGLSKVVIFEGNLQNSVLNAMASTNQVGQLVKNLSCSWGWGGGPSTTTDNIFKIMQGQGQSFFNASGDTDAFAAGSNNDVDIASQANAPSSCPYITQVGGTVLTMVTNSVSHNLEFVSETVWNYRTPNANGGNWGSSGGISTFYAIPAWQTNTSMTGAKGSTTKRNIPDVALTADYVYSVSGNLSGGRTRGTSVSAPLWAGLMALVNQQAALAGRPSAGFINPAVYALSRTASYTNCFHDVKTGDNVWSPSSTTSFYAVTNYDLCTGLGTPAGQKLIDALAGTDALIVTPLAGAATGVAGGPFSITAGNFLLTNASSSPLTWSLVSPSAWLNISATSGTLAAHVITNLTATLTAAASNLAVGTYPASLTFSNGTSHALQIGLFTLQVNQPLLVTPASGFTAAGPVGGAFSVTSQDFLLTNQGGSSLPWSLINTSSWLSASPASGTLAGSAQTTMTVSLTAAANTLAAGIYTANVLVTNRTGVAASLPFTINVGQPIVINGGFEAGNFTGWTETGTTTYMSVSTTATYIHAGTHGAQLGPSGALSYLSQNLVTTPGSSYLLACSLVNPKGGTANQFVVQWNGATIYNLANFTATTWTNLHFIVTATSVTTPLQFGFQNDPDYFGFDDVSVTPVAPVTFKSSVKAANNFQLVWNTSTGLVYQVQYKTNLLQTNWINLGSAATAKTNSMAMTDTNAFLSSRQRFYRLVASP